MKNITLSADEELIEAARARARDDGTSLNEEFRRWLAQYADRRDSVADTMRYIRELQETYSTGGRKFTREELNERR